MYETAVRTIGKARSGGGPSLVEALTYRHGGHSRGDPATYRPAAEVREWLGRDPIKHYRNRLASLGVDDEAQRKVDLATEEARNAPPARVEDIETQVWSDGGSAWRN